LSCVNVLLGLWLLAHDPKCTNESDPKSLSTSESSTYFPRSGNETVRSNLKSPIASENEEIDADGRNDEGGDMRRGRKQLLRKDRLTQSFSRRQRSKHRGYSRSASPPRLQRSKSAIAGSRLPYQRSGVSLKVSRDTVRLLAENSWKLKRPSQS